MYHNNNCNLNPKILKRFQLLNLLKEGYITVEKAAKELNLSSRQVLRIVKRFKASNQSVTALMPKPKPSPRNKKDQEIRELAAKLKKENPQRSNQYIAELIEQKLKQLISPSTVRRILIENRCYQKSKIRRKPFRRFEASSFGEIVQMDTCGLLAKRIFQIKSNSSFR